MHVFFKGVNNMCDSLFFMQRYWGSDEEDNNEANNINPTNNPKVSHIKQINKKQKLDHPVIQIEDPIIEIQKSDLDSSKIITNESCSLTSNLEGKGLKSKSKGKKQFKDTHVDSQDSITSHPYALENIVQNGFTSECDKNIGCDLNKNVCYQKKKSKDSKETYKKIRADKIDSDVEDIRESNCVYSNEIFTYKSYNCTKASGLEVKSLKNKLSGKKNLLESTQIESNKSVLSSSYISENIVKTACTSEHTDDIGYSLSKDVNIQKEKSKSLKKTFKKESELSKKNSCNSVFIENTVENFCTIGHVQQQKAVKVKQVLPHWLSNPIYIKVNLEQEKIPVSQLDYLDSNTKKNLKEYGIEFLFPVQLAVLPWLMQSKNKSLLIRPSDICVSAPTGSGKTLAFVLPIIQSLKERVVCAVRALIVLPVSELAIQVFKVFEAYIQGTDLKVKLLTGQKSFITEQNALVKCIGNKIQSLADIVVTTPGRMYDHIFKTKGFCLKRLQYLVIDEADRMMEVIQKGWLKQIEDAVFQDCHFSNCVCSNNKRKSFEPSSAFNFGHVSQPLQKLLYSATLTHDPEQLHSLFLYKPKLFSASSSTTTKQEHTRTCTVPDKLSMFKVICEEGVKPMVICSLINQFQFKRVLCFTESVDRAHRLHLLLEEMGLFEIREISSLNRAIQRKIAIQQFASGKVNILVCSDLVARGIDIENIDCVISYDVPQYVKIYIHRIGRTARAGKSGTAVTLLSNGEIPHFKTILKSANIEMPKDIDISNEDLKPYINSYQNALLAADTKLKKEKCFIPGKSSRKTKRKKM